MYDLVMLLGGTGTRMDNKPDGNKHLVEIAGKPAIRYLKEKIETYEKAVAPFANKYVITNGKGVDAIMAELGQGYKYFFQEKPTGVPDAIRIAYPRNPALIQLGDQFYEEQIGKFMEGFDASDEVMRVWLKDSDQAKYHTTALFADSDNWIKRFIEKPNYPDGLKGMVCTGMYMIKPSALFHVPIDLQRNVKGENDMAGLANIVQENYGFKAVGHRFMNGYWSDINSQDKIIKAESYLK